MKADLLETLAKICHCAQENICDPEFHSTGFLKEKKLS